MQEVKEGCCGNASTEVMVVRNGGAQLDSEAGANQVCQLGGGTVYGKNIDKGMQQISKNKGAAANWDGEAEAGGPAQQLHID